MKNFCESLREHAMKIITFKRKKQRNFIMKQTADIISKCQDLL